MKKFIVPIVCISVIAGTYIFLKKTETLPHDFGTVLTSWQKQRADNLNEIISLWRDIPLGKGQRDVDVKVQYGDAHIT
jgi:hypothetical protein